MARKNKISSVKKSTDNIIDEAIARQGEWKENRRSFAGRFLQKMGLISRGEKSENRGTLSSYWFPILCAILVIVIALLVIFSRMPTNEKIIIIPSADEPTIVAADEIAAPSFDLVRIDRGGFVVVSGRWLPYQNTDIIVNDKISATLRADARGEFVFAPTNAWRAGNYTIRLKSDTDVKSNEDVFVYISERGYENSIALLMTKNGSTLLQSPKLTDGDLAVSKIDYLDTGRIVITGDALPRLRVSVTLDGKYLGFARVSDHKHFGFGADVEKLQSGKSYKLTIRLHDGDGKIVATVAHNFEMPIATGNDDTFYTVRRGDCLWIIARNFMRRGILFSIIADKNNIENPNLIFPKQILQIPINNK